MLNNEQIVNRIREIANKAGTISDSEICRRCKFTNRGVINNILKIKTAPQLDTLDKFAAGLGVGVEDLIYDRTDADMEMSQIWGKLSEYDKIETIVWIKMQLREKKQRQSKAA